MSIAPDQLDEIYRQISERFLSHPLISVTPTQGDPPDQYSIKYKISGLTQTDNGDIVEASEHTVELSIPFGFPHFPPSCRPKTFIYHPDFDPGAICIGDYWDKNPSLVDLILHIGQMINGESYSVHDAFNDKAAAWYDKNGGKFPLNKISWDQTEIEDEELYEDADLDTLDFEDLDFDGDEQHDMEEESPVNDLSDLFPSIDDELEKTDELDISTLHKIQNRNKFFALRTALEGQTEFSTELQALLDDTENIISDAERTYNEAKELEKQGNASKALQKYQAVASKVSDFPAIHADIKRLEQTLDLVEDLMPHEFDGTFPEPETTEELPVPELIPTPPETETAEPKPPKKKKRTITIPKIPFTLPFSLLPVNRLIIFASLALLLVIFGTYYTLHYIAKSNLQEAQNSYELCTEAMEAGDFQNANKQCNNGLESAGNVLLFQKNKADEIKAAITKVVQSEKFIQGLKGNILVSGRYVSKKEAILIQDLKSKTDAAEKLFQQNKFKEASATFREALKIAKNIKSADSSLITELDLKIKLCIFKDSLQLTNTYFNEQKWQTALEKIAESQNHLKNLPDELQKEYSGKLQILLTFSKFELARIEGDNAVNSGDWAHAIYSYNKSLDYAQKLPDLQRSKIDSVESSIARANLYQTLEAGNNAFAVGDWDTAIESYKKANKTLVDSKFTLIDQTKSNLSRIKLNKIILQASIIRDQQSIQSMLNKDEIRGARDAYKNLLMLIESSSLAGENEFTKAKGDINKQLKQLEQKIYISDRKAHLDKNYKDLFAKNYEISDKESLTSPVIKLVKNTKTALIFRMQCTEKRSGRPLTLVMFYSYNKTNGKWALSSGN